jgi:hypothetical protein
MEDLAVEGEMILNSIVKKHSVMGCSLYRLAKDVESDGPLYPCKCRAGLRKTVSDPNF